jgi:hypothetical protein
VLTAGPRWYRRRLRLLGPIVALVPPALLGVVAWLVLRGTDGRTSGMVGLAAGVVAAPGLLVAGAPFGDQDTYRLAALASAPLWMVIGVLASRRATRSPMASWRDYWREYSWLAAAVAVGALGALAVAAVVLGESLW